MNRREEREPWGCTWGKKGTRYRRGLEGHQARVRPVKSREGGGMRDTPPPAPQVREVTRTAGFLLFLSGTGDEARTLHRLKGIQPPDHALSPQTGVFWEGLCL